MPVAKLPQSELDCAFVHDVSVTTWLIPLNATRKYRANFGTVKSRQPVDWVFFVNRALAFLVEAKAVRMKIDHYDEQLGGYYAKHKGR